MGSRDKRLVTLGDGNWVRTRLRPTSPYPDGRCKLCGCRLTGRRKSYCSNECSQAYSMFWFAHAPHWLRLHVFIRDDFTCAGCGLRPGKQLWVPVWRSHGETSLLMVENPALRDNVTQKVGAFFAGMVPDFSRLVMHHCLPLEHGGDNSDENLVTLCNEKGNDCHARVHRYMRTQPQTRNMFAEVPSDA